MDQQLLITFQQILASSKNMETIMAKQLDAQLKTLHAVTSLVTAEEQHHQETKEILEELVATNKQEHPKTKIVYKAILNVIKKDYLGTFRNLPRDKAAFVRAQILLLRGPAQVDEADPLLQVLVDHITAKVAIKYYNDTKSIIKKKMIEDVLLESSRDYRLSPEQRDDILNNEEGPVIQRHEAFLDSIFVKCKKFKLLAQAGQPSVESRSTILGVIKTTFEKDPDLRDTSNGQSDATLDSPSKKRKISQLQKSNSTDEIEPFRNNLNLSSTPNQHLVSQVSNSFASSSDSALINWTN